MSALKLIYDILCMRLLVLLDIVPILSCS